MNRLINLKNELVEGQDFRNVTNHFKEPKEYNPN